MAMSPRDLRNLLNRNLPAVDQRGEIVEEVGADFVRLRLPVIESYFSHDLPEGSGQKLLSAPILVGFAETALYACAHAFYGTQVFVATLTLNVSFLRVAEETDLVAVARLLRRGRGIAFLEVHITSDSAEESCAHVTASYAIKGA